MRKQIKPDKICEHCGTVLQHGDEEWFCDVCKEKIPHALYGRKITIFFENRCDDTLNIDVCSWKCVADWLKNPSINKDSVHFIAIPYISKTGTESFSEVLNKFLKAFEMKNKV